MDKTRNWVYRQLRRSESFFKTDMVYLAKGGFWLTFGQVASLVVSFLLSIAFANLMSQYEYGTYKYILSVIGLFGVISLSGLGTALTRSVATGHLNSIWKAFFINIRWSLIITLVSGIFGIYYLAQGNAVLGASILIAGALTPVIDSSELYNSFLAGTQQFKRASLVKFLRVLLVSAGVLAALILTDNLIVIILTYFVLHAISGAWIFYRVAREVPKENGEDPELLKLGKHVSLMNGFSYFVDKIDNVLVFQFLGPIQLAVYNFAQIIPNNLSGLIKNIGTLATPRFAQGDKEVIKRNLIGKSFRIFVVGLLLLAAYVLLAPPIFSLLFPQYRESILYSQAYAFIILFSGALPIAFLDAQVAIRTKYTQIITSSVFKLVAISLGLYYFGLWGLIIARILSKIFGIILVFTLIRRV